MPGHPLIEAQHEQVKKDVEQLEKLISEHDAVFLLTDSRESRWLPTLLCKSQNKVWSLFIYMLLFSNIIHNFNMFAFAFIFWINKQLNFLS